MSGFDLSTYRQLSIMPCPSNRLSNFGQIEQKSDRGPFVFHCGGERSGSVVESLTGN